jgi:hypothetical protein
MGLLNDPLGERLPDELWRQAAPEAEAELGGNDPKSIKSNYEFPADLIRHCEQEALEAVAADTAGLVRAVLRASGYAELVAERDQARRERETMRAERLAECEGLRAQNAEVVAALKEIGKQRTSDELDAEENAHADYQFAYDACVAKARAALAAAGHKPT